MPNPRAEIQPTISPGMVHIWKLWMNDGDNGALLDLLSPDERARAHRFQFDLHRLRFVACRARLRMLLAHYTASDARRISFVSNRHGKPALGGALSASGIQFNVSHSEDLAVLAFSLGFRIGVDVEWARPSEWQDQIARNHFSADEYRFYAATPPAYRYRVFFSCWTRKEAYLKAIGKGLSFPMKQVSTGLPNARSVLASASGSRRWSMQAFTPAPGYVAALVAEDPDCGVMHLSRSDLPRCAQAARHVGGDRPVSIVDQPE